ncbi:carbohydrate ABC transporter permease [Paenibacillus cymbidii]|uniref:carbohydrate ABC transporter permease n=1 Tax=Paenibacillus cymbidii TaxID=1639034 RepID=UPI0010810CC8|nr:carbohydrate ABC transporter permease [Paenibacillus cymbidii]
MRQRLTGFDYALYALLACVVIATLYPFVYMIAVSLSDSVHVLKGDVFLWPKGWNVDVYKVVLQDPLMVRAYGNTILYVVLGTAISLLVTAAGAFAVAKKEMLFHRGFMMMIVATMFFSGGMIPTFLVVKSYGLVDTIWGMVLPTAVSTWNLIVMRTFFAGLPKEVEESGRIDGLNDIGVFVRLALPLSKAILATIGLFYAVGIWNNFFSAMLYLRSTELFPLQVVLRNIVLQGVSNSNQATNIGGDTILVDESLKFATIMVSTLPILMVYPFLQKYFAKGALIGSIKG